MVEVDTARRFLAAEFESAGLLHVAGDILGRQWLRLAGGDA